MNEPQNIFSNLPQAPGPEHFATLLETAGVKIERIVSRSYANRADFWHDQDHDEWVLVLRGDAVLEFAGGRKVALKTGDHLLVPRHVRHRVDRTSEETVWLAVHLGR